MSAGEYEPRREFVALPSVDSGAAAFGAHPLQGVFMTPGQRQPTVAFIASHYELDFTEHYLGPLLAQRGFGFLGWNHRYRGNGMYFRLDAAVSDIGIGIRWLREHGVERIVLLGNSGGASLMAAYQSQATSPNLVAGPGSRLTAGLDDLMPADLYVSLAAHPGRADLNVNCLDPSVVDESDPWSSDPALDMYDESNGPPFDSEFQRRYHGEQVRRNRRISAWARSQLEALRRLGHPVKDRLFVVNRLWADLRFIDAAIEPSDRHVPGCWLGDPRRANAGVAGIGTVNTLRTWLSMWSIDDSQARVVLHGPNIRIPSLVVAASGDTGVFDSDTKAILDSLASTDKQSHTLKGDHYFLAPDGARAQVADLLEGWVQERI
jgi:hypothetical protein